LLGEPRGLRDIRTRPLSNNCRRADFASRNLLFALSDLHSDCPGNLVIPQWGFSNANATGLEACGVGGLLSFDRYVLVTRRWGDSPG